MDPDEKRCSKCGETKAISEFPVRRDRGNRPRSHCRECHNAPARLPRTKAMQRAADLRRKYGITVEHFDSMLRFQKGRCGICLEGITEKTANVDHDHLTGRVRALLCGPCNRALGLFRDDLVRVQLAAEYLRRHGTRPKTAETG